MIAAISNARRDTEPRGKPVWVGRREAVLTRRGVWVFMVEVLAWVLFPTVEAAEDALDMLDFIAE